MKNLRGALAILFIVANTIICCIPIYLLAIPRALLRFEPLPEILGAAMTRVIDLWVSGNRLMMRALSITQVHTEWAITMPLSRDQWYLIIANHQGWSDILILQDLFLELTPPLKFFVKRQLLWVPFIGFAMWLLEFPYVRRYGKEALAANPALRVHDQNATRAACDHFKRRPTSVLNFMEGTRFTQAKHAFQGSSFKNLLMPKSGGFGYVIGALGDRISQVLDVTIVYPNGVPSFWGFLCGGAPTVNVAVTSLKAPAPVLNDGFEISDQSRDELREWVNGLWSQKDTRIDKMREACR